MDDKVRAGVSKVIQRIVDRDGSITAEVLLETAKPKNSPAHGGFEWDDSKAGHEYRLIQSRRWIRTTPIQVTDPETKELTVEALAWIKPHRGMGPQGEYKPLSVIVENIDEFQRALQAANELLSAAKRAVDDLLQAANHEQRADNAAVIAQMSKGLQLFGEALHRMQ